MRMAVVILWIRKNVDKFMLLWKGDAPTELLFTGGTDFLLPGSAGALPYQVYGMFSCHYIMSAKLLSMRRK